MKKFLISVAVMISALVLFSASAFAVSSSSTSSKKSESYTVLKDGVNVRSGPGTSFSRLGSLSKGTKETGTVKDGWLEFTYNGKSAYCMAKYFKGENDTATVSAAASTGKTAKYVVSAKELNIRSGPGATYSSLGKLKKGTEETGVVTDGWLKFTYNKETAYLNIKYMTAAA